MAEQRPRGESLCTEAAVQKQEGWLKRAVVRLREKGVDEVAGGGTVDAASIEAHAESWKEVYRELRREATQLSADNKTLRTQVAEMQERIAHDTRTIEASTATADTLRQELALWKETTARLQAEMGLPAAAATADAACAAPEASAAADGDAARDDAPPAEAAAGGGEEEEKETSPAAHEGSDPFYPFAAHGTVAEDGVGGGRARQWWAPVVLPSAPPAEGMPEFLGHVKELIREERAQAKGNKGKGKGKKGGKGGKGGKGWKGGHNDQGGKRSWEAGGDAYSNNGGYSGQQQQNGGGGGGGGGGGDWSQASKPKKNKRR
eukprot:Rhum_TRINITY_DN11701_c1_g1::Rhum_TRINITY_DN11701_c1_g1_i1::g.46333::m.46333